jgi:hypothetical protein
LADLLEAGEFSSIATTRLGVAGIKLGLAVRSGATVPDIKTLDAFKQTLLRADTIIHTT